MAKKARKSANRPSPRKTKATDTAKASQAPQSLQTPTARPAETVAVSEQQNEQHRILRAAHARFAKAIPVAAASSGAHEPQEAVEVPGVPNGDYRIAGADWIMTVTNGAVTVFQRAQPGVDFTGVTEIPPPETTRATS
jgi:hypothetical protein